MFPVFHSCRAAVLLALLLMSGVDATAVGRGEEEEPPLPTWDVLPAPGDAFSNLMPEGAASMRGEDFFLSTPGAMGPPPVMLQDPAAGPYDFSRFLPGSLLNVPTQARPGATPTPAIALRDVPAGVLAGLADAPLNEYLLDAQTLVTEVPGVELQRLLEFHATEARILFYLLVIDKNQKLGSPQALDPLVTRLGRTGREVCVAVYPLGEPWRTRILLSPGVTASCPVASLSEMAEDCIADAMQAEEPEPQLRRLAVRLSTRLFWLEKLLPPTAPPASLATGTPTLHEVERTPASSSPTPPARATLAPIFGSDTLWQVTGLVSACVLLGASAAFGFRKLLQWRAGHRPRHIWMLEECEGPPRLGGAFSGGAGAQMSYAPPKSAL